MRRSHLIRTLSLGLASIAVAGASLAATVEQQQLYAARDMADTDPLVAQHLTAWLSDSAVLTPPTASEDDAAVSRLAEADGLITHRLRKELAAMARGHATTPAATVAVAKRR